MAPDDIVIHLGDLRLIPTFLEQLSGRLIMVAGNHDYKRDDKYYVEIVREPFVYIDDETQAVVELVHDPKDATGRYDYVFCGHVHKSWSYVGPGQIIHEHSDSRPPSVFKVQVPTFNVGVDVRGLRPVSFEEIIKGNK
mgnify:CR=1 FL=1